MKKNIWLFRVYIGDYTTHLYVGIKPLQGPLLNSQDSMESDPDTLYDTVDTEIPFPTTWENC